MYKHLRKTQAESKQDRLIREWKKGNKPRQHKKRNKPDVWNRLLKKVKGKNYREFIISEYWLKVRLLILKRDGYKCTICGTTKQLHVHHTTYKNHFKEHLHLEDLQTLCKQHHTEIHQILDIT